MAFRWVCNTCGQLHGSNPQRCRGCGASVLSPLSKSKVAEHTTSPADVESLNPDEIVTYGTAPEPDFQSSPDVAPDGSIATDDAWQESSLTHSRGQGVLWGVPVELVGVLALVALLAAMLLLL